MKMTKRIKKAMLIVIMAMTVMMMTAGSASAATTVTQKAKKAYATFLAKEGYKKNMDGWSTSGLTFQLAYINGDSIPDLVVKFFAGPRGYSNGLFYTYKNGKVTYLGKTGGDLMGYYKKKNCVLTDSRYDGEGNRTITYTKPMTGYGYATGDFGKTIRYNKSTKYFKATGTYSSTEITKTQILTLKKKRVGSTKLSAFKTVANNATNRKRLLGYTK